MIITPEMQVEWCLATYGCLCSDCGKKCSYCGGGRVMRAEMLGFHWTRLCQVCPPPGVIREYDEKYPLFYARPPAVMGVAPA